MVPLLLLFFSSTTVLCHAAVSPSRHHRRGSCSTQPTGPRRVIMSAYQANPTPGSLPVAFNWMNILSANFTSSQRAYVLLLHGACLSYGLKSRPGLVNPFESFLTSLHSRGVSIKICHLCMDQNGFLVTELMSFVEPVAFSVDYLIQQQEVYPEAIVLYDSPVPTPPPGQLPTLI